MEIKRYRLDVDEVEMVEDPKGEWVRESSIAGHVAYWLKHWREFCGILNQQLDEVREQLRSR